MVAYILLGIGIFLVFISIIFTYRGNRKENNMPVSHQRKSPVSSHYLRAYQQTKPSQDQGEEELRSSIGSLGGELDHLIRELKEKEVEIKEVINRAKQWNQELSDPIFAELLRKKMIYQESETRDHRETDLREMEREKLIQPSEDEAAAVKNPSSVDAVPLEQGKETQNKYVLINRLSEEGYSVAEIARMLNLGYREVELVVKLRKKGVKNSG